LTKTVGCDRISPALLAAYASVWGQGRVGGCDTCTARFAYWFLLFLRLSNLVKGEKVAPINPPESITNLECGYDSLLGPSPHSGIVHLQVFCCLLKRIEALWLDLDPVPHIQTIIIMCSRVIPFTMDYSIS
jgi:hypothetical protein